MTATDLEMIQTARKALADAKMRAAAAQADVDRYAKVVAALEGARPPDQQTVTDLALELAAEFTRRHKTNGVAVVFDYANLRDLCRELKPADLARFTTGVYPAFKTLARQNKICRDAGGWRLA